MTPTDKLLNLYHQATPEQLDRGRRWYDRARAECGRMSRLYSMPLGRTAAAMAITSPDAKLVQNVRWTERVLADKAKRRGVKSAGRYPADQRPKLEGALDRRKPNPAQYVSGPKVSAFYHAIMGDADILVIDRWAAFAAGFPRDRAPRARERDIIGTAYRQAAERVGESVRDFQAIVWIVVRESTPRSDGRIHNHFDF